MMAKKVSKTRPFNLWLLWAFNMYTVSQKTKQICFCQNFVKFPPISIIFGTKMRNNPDICEVHSFSTSPNLRHHLTVLNANVPNCYITPKLLVIDRSHWRPQFIRGRRHFGTIRILGNASGVFCRRKFIAPKLLTSMNSKRVSSTSGRSSTSRSLMPRSASCATVWALVSVHVGHTSSISSDNFEQKCYRNL